MKKFSVARLMAALLVAVLTLGACGDDTTVGGEVEVDPNADAGGFNLDDATSTTAAPSTTVTTAAASGPSTTQKVSTTTTGKETTTTTAKPAIEVTINGDNSGKVQFDPSVVSVFEGGLIVFRNTDSVPRSVESDREGAFKSPEIAPGATWELRAKFGTGRFNYHDGTRPYAVGTISVAKR